MSNREDGHLDSEFSRDPDIGGGGGPSGNPSGQNPLAPSSQSEMSPSAPQATHSHLAIPSTAPEEEVPVGPLPFSYATEEAEIVDPELRRVFHYSSMSLPNGPRCNLMTRIVTNTELFISKGKAKHVPEGPAQLFTQNIYHLILELGDPARRQFDTTETQMMILADREAAKTETKRVPIPHCLTIQGILPLWEQPDGTLLPTGTCRITGFS